VGLLEASCAATAKALSEQLEGELRGLRRLRISRHLGRCSRCRATLASLARLVRVLGTTRDAEPRAGDSVVERVLMRIREIRGSRRDDRR
jgi:predicted anti-sigma-YlaC factor YlaD